MSPQRVATGPLCRRPSRPPLPPPGSHSGSEPSGGVADEDLDAACPDIDAPYEFSSTDMCAQISTDDPEQPPDESDSATRAVLAAAAVVAALVF